MVIKILDPNSISFIFSVIFLILAITFGLKKHKGWDLKILFYLIAAYFLGSTIYPAFSILYYSFQKTTLLGEPLTNYTVYFGLSGVLLIAVAIIGMVEMLKNKKKNTQGKINKQKAKKTGVK